MDIYEEARTLAGLMPRRDFCYGSPFLRGKPATKATALVDLSAVAPLGLKLDFHAADWPSSRVLPPRRPPSAEAIGQPHALAHRQRPEYSDALQSDSSWPLYDEDSMHGFQQAAAALEVSRRRCNEQIDKRQPTLDEGDELWCPGSGPVSMPKEVEDDFEHLVSASFGAPKGTAAWGTKATAEGCEDLFDKVAREQQIFRTLVVTHIECKNHITPASSGVDYMHLAGRGDSFSEGEDSAEGDGSVVSLQRTSSTVSGESKKRRREPVEGGALGTTASPEQPERVTAVFQALRQCRWECGGVRVVEPVELTTSPTLASALDENLADWAAPRRSSHRGKPASSAQNPPRRTTSVSYLFDDIEPIVLSVHDMGYLSRVANEIEIMNADNTKEDDARRSRKLFRCVSVTATGDTFASARSLHAALCASFAVCRAVDAVVSREYRNAFCCVRPPGHHAGAAGSTYDDSGDLVGQGFCLINNVAVAARYALANHKSINRVAVIDWDLHHGNGTQQILCADDGPIARDALCDSVLFCSIHGATPPGQHPHLFPGTGRGREGDAVNIPLPAGTGHVEFLDKFHAEVIPAAEAFKPDLILISAGFDGHKDDLFKFLKLTDKTFKLMTEAVMALADRVRPRRAPPMSRR